MPSSRALVVLLPCLLLGGACGSSAINAGYGDGGGGGAGDGGDRDGDGGVIIGEPPVVAFVAPEGGAQLAGNVTLSATATDDVGVVGVEFRLDAADGTALGVGVAAGTTYTLEWNSVAAANGAHTLYAIATDTDGNTSAATVRVTVQNAVTTTGGLVVVPTFEVLGLYLPRSASTGDITTATVEFRQAGQSVWRPALPLWYDARNTELRGSILGLSAGLAYEVQVKNPGGTVIATGTFGTWPASFAVDEDSIVTIDGVTTTPITITQSGTPSAYRLYEGAAAGGTIDMGFAPVNDPQPCITVRASYVIIRALTLKNCQASAIELEEGAHDVVIEGNDISNFGTGPGNPVEGETGTIRIGDNETAAIACTGYNLAPSEKPSRIIVQGNRITNPRYGSNPWSYGHPIGANGVGFFECGGNHVIRYNDVLGSQGHYFMDGIGGSDNFTSTGFPNNDSDIYGNYIAKAYDDGIEAEGGNRQVRIWGNYITNTFIGIANGTVTHGPIYVLRNITSNHAGMWDPAVANPDNDEERGLFFKLGSQDDALVGGKAYYFHNTSLQPACPAGTGADRTCGIDSGMQNSAGNVRARNLECANNIFTNFNSGHVAIGYLIDDDSGTFEKDLTIGGLDVTDVGGINAYPIFTSDVDEALETNTYVGAGGTVALRSADPTRTPNEIGDFSLAANSPGRGVAKVLPTVNDAYAQPDIGAHQSGTTAMKFGTAAWTGARAY